MDIGQRREILEFLPRNFVNGSRFFTRSAGVDDDHLILAAHLKRDIHSGRSAINAKDIFGETDLPHPPDQDRPDGIIRPEKVSATDY
jgi:hypothetical protein